MKEICVLLFMLTTNLCTGQCDVNKQFEDDPYLSLTIDFCCELHSDGAILEIEDKTPCPPQYGEIINKRVKRTELAPHGCYEEEGLTILIKNTLETYKLPAGYQPSIALLKVSTMEGFIHRHYLYLNEEGEWHCLNVVLPGF